MPSRCGVWFVGARGGVATTAIVGALGLRQQLVSSTGLITETPLAADLPLATWDQLVFGGHDIRTQSLCDSAHQIRSETQTIPYPLIETLRPALDEVEQNLRVGILHGSGAAIEALGENARRADSAAAGVDLLAQDLADFRSRHDLERVVVVNLSSTEPTITPHPAHATRDGLAGLLAKDHGETVIASTLYALAAARTGCGYVNFTPSPGALLPGVADTFEHAGLPFMGSDGKTGETLVKSALAPMFRYRNLRILSWLGYNMLGDRDGQVLKHEENRRTKVSSKDQLLHDYLGYPLHSQVSIDYVPSLKDLKTAWDFIHFQGFLDYKMSLQFTWQGCDAILAAPLVLDLVRFTDLALQRQEAGALHHLAVFFKNPFDVPEHDLHRQFHTLLAYIERVAQGKKKERP